MSLMLNFALCFAVSNFLEHFACLCTVSCGIFRPNIRSFSMSPGAKVSDCYALFHTEPIVIYYQSFVMICCGISIAHTFPQVY